MSNEMAVYEGTPAPMSVVEMKQQVKLIQTMMREVMRKDEHFGVIPGTNKPSLLKAGAEKLIMTFRLVPDVEEHVIDLPNEHREYRVKVRLYTQSGIFLGAGVGSCTTMEGKYRFRKADLVCPECEQATIIKGKAEFGGGWLCYQKKGGCGKKWTDEDNPFAGVSIDRVEHDNPADYYNTCLKMAKKRALVDACLTVTAASDIFTQDVEDMPEVIPGAAAAKDKKPPIQQPQAKSEQKVNDLGDPAPDEEGCFTIDSVVQDVQQQKGKKGDKEWTKYHVQAGGEKYSTFDKKIAEDAKKSSEMSIIVTIRFKKSQYGNDIVSLTMPEEVPLPGMEGEAAS